VDTLLLDGLEVSPRLHALHRTIARPATFRKVEWCTQIPTASLETPTSEVTVT
jgi:hypothetical protein